MAKKKEAQIEEVAEVKSEPVKKAAKTKQDLTNLDMKAITKMRNEYFQKRLDISLGKDNAAASLKQMRRDIARALMHLHNKATK